MNRFANNLFAVIVASLLSAGSALALNETSPYNFSGDINFDGPVSIENSRMTNTAANLNRAGSGTLTGGQTLDSATIRSNLVLTGLAVASTNAQILGVLSSEQLLTSLTDATNVIANPSAQGQILVLMNVGTNSITFAKAANLAGISQARTLLRRCVLTLIAQTTTNWVDKSYACDDDVILTRNVTANSNLTVAGTATSAISSPGTLTVTTNGTVAGWLTQGGRRVVTSSVTNNVMTQFGTTTNTAIITFSPVFLATPNVRVYYMDTVAATATVASAGTRTPTNFTVTAPGAPTIGWDATGTVQ